MTQTNETTKAPEGSGVDALFAQLEQERVNKDLSPTLPKAFKTPTNTTEQPIPTKASPTQLEDPGFGDYAADIGKGVINGGMEAVAETYQFGWDVATGISNKVFGTDFDDVAPGYETIQDAKFTTQTALGDITENITALGVGMLGAGKFLKAAKLLQGGGKAMTIGRGMTQGAIADFTVVNPIEENLCAIAEKHEWFDNVLTNAMATDPNDSTWENRARNAIEGVVLGGAVDTILGGIRLLRGVKYNNPAEVAKAVANSEKLSAQLPKDANGNPVYPLNEAEAARAAVKKGTLENPVSVVSVEVQADEIFKTFKNDTRPADEVWADIATRVAGTRRHSFTDADTHRLVSILADKVFDHTSLGAEGRKSLKELTSMETRYIKNIKSELSIEDALAEAAGNEKLGYEIIKEAHRFRRLHTAVANEYREIGELIESGAKTAPEDFTKFMYLGEKLAEMAVADRNLRSVAGRFLVSLKAPVKPPTVFAAKGLNDLRKALRETRFTETVKNISTLPEYVKALNSRKFGSYLEEYYLNSILSGPFTHVVNVTGNAIKAFATHVDTAAGYAVKGEFQKAGDVLWANSHLMSNFLPAMKMAKLALKENKAILDAGGPQAWSDIGNVNRAWSKENVRSRALMNRMQKGMSIEQAVADDETWEEVISSSVIDGLGKIVNAPTRLIGGEDEFFKQWKYRSDAQAHFTAEAWEAFGRDNTEAIAKHVKEEMDKLFHSDGRAVDEDWLQNARKATFSQDLEKKSIGKFAQDLSNSHPFFKLILPFVRTPTNLLLESRSRVPLIANFTKEYKDAIAKGGAEAAEAQGRLATGSLMMVGTMTLAANGFITGSMPADPKIRDSLRREGWQPNSIKIGDTYYSFGRLDPFATLMTSQANLIQLIKTQAETDNEDLGEFMTAFLVAHTKLLADKSYFQTLSTALDAITGDERAVNKLATDWARGIVPYTGMMNTFRKERDTVVRDVNSISDRITNVLPGFSDSLPAKHDWLTGKPVMASHNFVSTINTDPVAREITNIGGLYRGVPYKVNGVELTTQQHSRYEQLIGTINLNGLNLHQAINRAIRQDAYDLQRQNHRVTDEDRAKQLNKIISRYRKEAGNQLMREDAQYAESRKNPPKRMKAGAAHFNLAREVTDNDYTASQNKQTQELLSLTNPNNP